MAVAACFELTEGTVPSTPTTGNWKLYFKSGGLYVVDDAGTETNIAILEGESEIIIPASQMVSATTSGAADGQIETTTNAVNVATKDFDTSADEYVSFSLFLPDNYDGGTLTAEFVWTDAGGTPGQTVTWAIQGRAFADDDALDQALGTAVTVADTLIATEDVHITSATSAMTLAGSPAANQLAIFRIYRDTSEDDISDDAQLISVKLTYTKG
jgi:hypothetical protein